MPVPPSEIPNIVTHLERTLANHSVERITGVRSQLVYNFGRASEVAAEQLAAIYQREKARPQTKKSARPAQAALPVPPGAA